MDLKTQDETYIISKNEKDTYDEIVKLAQELKPKWFYLGRIVDKLVKLGEKLKK